MSYRKLKFDTWTKYRFPIVYLVILLFLLLFYVFEIAELNFKSFRFQPSVKINLNEGFEIKTSGCRIPYLDPYDKSVLPFIYKPKHFVCSLRPPLVSSNLTSLYLELDSLEYYGISNVEDLKCCYQTFWRVDPVSHTSDNIYAYGKCRLFNLSAEINVEFIKIKCAYNDSIIYIDYHSFVTNKREKEVLPRKNNDKLNLLIIGLDAISRLNFHRTMPKTVKYLKEHLNAIELTGYNKVGDNTFPNLIPILTGLSEDELTKLCWQHSLMKFDNCPFIWNRFREAGYLTSFAEDSAWMGIFNYEKTGFKHQPTDYYWKTFSFLAEKGIGHSRLYNADLCLGSRPTYIVMLQYIDKFIQKMKNNPYFGFFWSNSLSHDNLNFPSMGDDNYKSFFETLKGRENLNNTILVVLSDHGIRWGGIRSTHQGQLEERLPFVFFIFPKWFQDKYSLAITNLKRNTRRLTTPFDLHETITEVLTPSNLLPENIKLRSTYTNHRGISLFLPIPDNRTCETAEIAQHWCTCQKSIAIDTNDTNVITAANYTVEYMNKILERHVECAILKLDKILDARLLKTEDYLQNNSTIYDYIIIIETVPGGGKFESTVRTLLNSGSFNLTGTISRINMYGKQSACISNFHLKLYCYCGG